jgi:hypothetical protein
MMAVREKQAMWNEIAEHRRRHYLALLDIDVYPSSLRTTPAAIPQTAEANATVAQQSVPVSNDMAAASAPDTERAASERAPSASATAAANKAQSTAYSHECLLLCEPGERDLTLLQDILRHVPALAAADDEYLLSHMVTSRQLAALCPRILLSTTAAAETATASGCEQRLEIDLKLLQSDPVKAKLGLWHRLQALANAEHILH